MVDSWVLAAVAVLLLRAGFALYDAGISRSKNAAAGLARVSIEIAVGILMYWAIGAAIRSGSISEVMNPRGLDALFVAGSYLIGPAIIAGAALERSRTGVCVAAAILLPGVLAPLIWKILHSQWLARMGFIDESGALYLHFSAGIAAAVAAIMLGPRLGKYNRDGSTNAIPAHNFPLAAAGVFLIFVLWIPYVAAGALDPAKAAMNVALAASAGLIAAMSYCRFTFGRQDFLVAYAGLMGGLVSMTAGADHLASWAAVLIGAVAGWIVPFVLVRLDLSLKIDDPAGGITIHGLGGLWSVVALALLAPGTIGQRAARVGADVLAIAIVAIVTLLASLVVFVGLRSTGGVRVREIDEIDGLDLSEFELNAYPDFQQTTIKSYHLREK